MATCAFDVNAEVERSVRVASAASLSSAMGSGAAHIQITGHLDLSELAPVVGRLVWLTYFKPQSTLRSITVRPVHSMPALSRMCEPTH
jgi:hypothetical protein